jgi:hypothetical protein
MGPWGELSQFLRLSGHESINCNISTSMSDFQEQVGLTLGSRKCISHNYMRYGQQWPLQKLYLVEYLIFTGFRCLDITSITVFAIHFNIYWKSRNVRQSKHISTEVIYNCRKVIVFTGSSVTTVLVIVFYVIRIVPSAWEPLSFSCYWSFVGLGITMGLNISHDITSFINSFCYCYLIQPIAEGSYWKWFTIVEKPRIGKKLCQRWLL